MSNMNARLQAMIAKLDDMLEPENEYVYPVTTKTPSGVKLTLDERMKSGDIKDWLDAFFSHPERIQIKRFEVKR